ncbi:MAG: hypothetical protein B7Z81_08965 [Acidocella sp. 20-61-6]|nr:MAG: hypothetical protein B7Z81_08965 [Acidocella sp. 20-61-6]
MRTEALIVSLAQDLAPVRRAPPPSALLLRWLVVTLPVLATIVLIMGPRPDLVGLMTQPRFLLAELLAGATALISAYAAFCAGRPDEPGWKLFLPMAAFSFWLLELGRQCFVLSVQTHAGGLIIHPDFMCVPVIALAGLVPAMAMVYLLRQSAMFRITHACLCGAMAAAAAAEMALPLFHAADTMMTVLVWQMGSVMLFTALGALAGRALLALRRGAPDLSAT